MSFTAVLVDVTDIKRPREVWRDARDPQGADQADLERLTRQLSENGRTIRLYVVGQYVKPWRKRMRDIDAEYEARNGQSQADTSIRGNLAPSSILPRAKAQSADSIRRAGNP
jgi:hypothetical protein